MFQLTKDKQLSEVFKFNLYALFLILLATSIILIDILSGNIGLTTDGCYYIQLAKNMVSGFGYSVEGELHTVFPPGYPILIILFAKLTHNYIFAAQLISVFSFIGSAILLWILLKKVLNNKKYSLLFLAIFIFNYSILFYAGKILCESLFIFMTLLNVALVLSILNKHSMTFRISALLGLLNGFMYLVKPEAFAMFLLNLLFIMVILLKHKNKMLFAKLLLMLIGFMLFVSPYVIFLHQASGKWALSGKSMNFVILEAVENHQDELIWEKKGYNILADGKSVFISSALKSDFKIMPYIWKSRKQLAKRILINGYSYLIELFKGFGLAILIIPVFLSIRFKIGINDQFVAYLAIYLMLSLYLLFFKIGQYWMPYFPVYVIFFAVLFRYIQSYSRINRTLLILLIISAICMNGFIYSNRFKKYIMCKNEFKIEKNAGEWVKYNLNSREVVVVRKPYVPFFAGIEWTRIPWFEESIDFIRYMRNNNFRYFILSKYERNTRPFLMNDEKNGNINKYALLKNYFGSKVDVIKLYEMK